MTFEKSEKIAKWILWMLIVVFVYTFVSYGVWDTNYRHIVCHEERTVVEIVKVRHRTVWLKLDDGTIVEDSQPKPAITPGSKRCVDATRERTDEPVPGYWIVPELFN